MRTFATQSSATQFLITSNFYNMTKITNLAHLEDGNYYRINGTKKILYWNGEIWCKPIKDNRGQYGGYIRPLVEQPKVKFAEWVEPKEIAFN